MSQPGPENDQKPPKRPQAGVATVELFTWGTHPDGGNGMAHYLDAQLMGGNVGHASVAVTFPADEEGLALVKQYCVKEDGSVILPFERTQKRVQDEDGNVRTTEVYKVYFSWWPDESKGYQLKPTVNDDREMERIGVDVGPLDSARTKADDPNALTPLETRVHSGNLGSRKMNLAPHEIATVSALSADQKNLLNLETRIAQLMRDVEALDVILEKLPDDEQQVKVGGTLEKLLDQHFSNPAPTWREKVGYDPQKKSLNREQMDSLKAMTSNLRETRIKTDLPAARGERNSAIGVIRARQQAVIAEEVSLLRQTLKSVPPENARDLIKKRKDFSVRAWNAYELEEVNKESKALNTFLSFAVSHFEYGTNKQLEEFFKAAIFRGQFPEGMSDVQKGEIRQGWARFSEQFNKPRRLTEDRMTPEIFNTVKNNAQKVKMELTQKRIELEKERELVRLEDPFLAGSYENFVSRGLSADDVVVMQVGGIKEGKQYQAGLNVEQMLAKMHDLTKDGIKFDLNTKNCSVTTGAILAAGAEPHLRTYFEEKA